MARMFGPKGKFGDVSFEIQNSDSKVHVKLSVGGQSKTYKLDPAPKLTANTAYAVMEELVRKMCDLCSDDPPALPDTGAKVTGKGQTVTLKAK